MSERHEISLDPARLDIATVHRWLADESYWAQGRTRAQQERIVAASTNFGLYAVDSGEQLGYARLVTDEVTFAWLADVYIDKSARGLGLGRRLLAAVCAHTDALGLRRVLLATRDAHGVYEQVDFTALSSPDQYMARMRE